MIYIPVDVRTLFLRGSSSCDRIARSPGSLIKWRQCVLSGIRRGRVSGDCAANCRWTTQPHCSTNVIPPETASCLGHSCRGQWISHHHGPELGRLCLRASSVITIEVILCKYSRHLCLPPLGATYRCLLSWQMSTGASSRASRATSCAIERRPGEWIIYRNRETPAHHNVDNDTERWGP